jgi:SPP1 family predicted phage head-tail adaptor
VPDTLAAGRLRSVVTIQDPVELQSTESGDVETVGWTDAFVNVRAELNFGNARELLAAAQVQSQLTAIVTLRWRPGLHAKQRLVWDDGGRLRYFNIAGVVPDKRTARTWVEIPVQEAEFVE